MSGQQKEAKARFIIVFYGDEGPEKVTTIEAPSDTKALKAYFDKSGAGQLSLIRNRTRAKPELTFNIIQDGELIRQIKAIDKKTALSWYAKELNLRRSFVEQHFTFELV